MAATLRCTSCPSAVPVDSERLLTAIHAGYGLWARRAPVNPNWWWNEIGVPNYVQAASVMVKGQLKVRTQHSSAC